MVIDSLRELLVQAIEQAQAASALPAFEIPPIEVNHPKQASHGDYSANVALVAAAAIRKETGEKVNLRQLAQAIVDHLPQNELVGDVELAGPGFINIHLADQW